MLPRFTRHPGQGALATVLLAGVIVAAMLQATARTQQGGGQAGAAAQAFPSDAAILAMIKQRVEEKRSAGIVVGIVEPGGQTRIVAFGDPGPGRPPLDGDTVFEIGSISKVFTSTLLAEMVLQGQVKEVDAQCTFVRDRQGVVTGLVLHQNAQNVPANKVK